MKTPPTWSLLGLVSDRLLASAGPADGFCGNWFAAMANTRQPLYPNASCAKDVRGGVAMPWCEEMVGGRAQPRAPAANE